MYRPRWMTDRLKLSETVFPVLALTGARQTGKTTLLANEPLFSDYLHVTLDDRDALERAYHAQRLRQPGPQKGHR